MNFEEFKKDVSWHALEAQEVFHRLSASAEGLSTDEAHRREAVLGPNELPPPRRQGPLLRFLLQFHNILIYILLAAAAVTAGFGHWVDTGVILGVVVINAIIGFIQEGKAERALEAIRATLSLKAVALRDGKRAPLAARDLVPGDVVLLGPGDKVPADMRLFFARELRVDESMLTGESESAEKGVAPVGAGEGVGDRTCMAYSGTLVTFGQGRGVVTATGSGTEVGRIGALLDETVRIETPILRDMARFGRVLTAWILALTGVLLAVQILGRGMDAADSFMAAVAIAVAAIPEGLPAVLTITMALGVQRMAARNAIVRRLPAVEALGSVTVICSDKTGTLTRNEMTVRAAVTERARYEVTGEGFFPVGGFRDAGQEVDPLARPDLSALLRAGVFCNEARLVVGGGAASIEGSATEGALLVAAAKAGLDRSALSREAPRLDLLPFASERRYMATMHRDAQGRGIVYLKGAPEEVLAMCGRADGGKDAEREEWHVRAHALADQGLRVLAAAQAPMNDPDATVLPGDLTSLAFRPLGLFGLWDPPREEALRAVAQCREAGVRVMMITGDHLRTAVSVANTFGIGQGRQALTGAQIDAMSDEELSDAVRDVDVFARASPAHKLRLVGALQARGEVVAMTGDGVNDAPALKRAEVGVAMGLKGTEAAKEAAEIVLADDNFASIAHAVEEGRACYDNLRKAIVFVLPTSVAEAMVVVAAILLNFPLPITPVQILWVNMITAVTLSLALSFEPPEEDVMRRPPRPPGQPLLSGFLLWRVSFVSLLFLAGTMGQFFWQEARGAGLEESRTAAVNALVLMEATYLFNTRRLLAPPQWGGNRVVPLTVLLVVGLQLLFTYAPPLQMLFGSAPVDLATWAVMAAVAGVSFLLVEAEKGLFRLRLGGGAGGGRGE